MSDELSPDARSIVNAGRAGDDPTEADRARVRATLLISIAGGASVAAAGTAAATTSAATAAWKGWALAKLLAGLTLAGAAVGVISIGLFQPTSDPRVHRATGAGTPAGEVAGAAASLSDVHTPLLLSPPAPSEPSVAGSGGARGAATARSAPSMSSSQIRPNSSAEASSPASTLEDETRKLRAAHAAMQSGDPARAIALLDEQSAAYADGVLRQERAAARVLALCQAGRVAEASAEAAQFLRENPTSPLADRVRASCAALPASAALPAPRAPGPSTAP